MEKLEVFYSKFHSALYIHFTVWADCVGESEIVGLANLITLIFYIIYKLRFMFHWINATNLRLEPFHKQKVL